MAESLLRKNIPRTIILTALLLCAAAWSQEPRPEAARRIFADLNGARAENHLPPLRWDNALTRAADQHTRGMATEDHLAHELEGEPNLGARVGASGTRVSAYAENVGMATAGADAVHDAWMHSPGHRANILNAAYDVVGIAAYEVNGKLYATEDFGTAVDIASADDAELVIRDQIAQLRAADRLPPLRIRPVRGSEGHCAPPALPALQGGESRSTVQYTTHDPKTLPALLKTRIGNSNYRAYAIAVCESRTPDGFTSISVYVIFTT